MERSFVPRSRKRGVQTIFPLQFFVFMHGFGPAGSSTFSCECVLTGCRLSCVLVTWALYVSSLLVPLKKGEDIGFVFRSYKKGCEPHRHLSLGQNTFALKRNIHEIE